MSTTADLTAAQDEYRTLRDQTLEWYGVEATPNFLRLDRPPMRAHALECGAGDPVVLIHGGGDETMIWAPLLARLQDDFCLHVPDRPGCGLSDGFSYGGVDLRRHATAFVTSLLDELDLDQVDVVACSAGGLFAFAAALEAPDRFRRLVFAGYPLGIVHDIPLNLRLVGGVPGVARLFAFMQSRSDPDDLRGFYEEEFQVDASAIPDIYFDAKHASYQIDGSVSSFASFVRASIGMRGLRPAADFTEDVAEIDHPALFLWGERDLAPPDAGRPAVSRMPDATFKVVEDAGHFPFHDRPDWTADRISEFLSGP